MRSSLKYAFESCFILKYVLLMATYNLLIINYIWVIYDLLTGHPVTVNCYRVQWINRLTVKPSTYMLMIICNTWYFSLTCF